MNHMYYFVLECRVPLQGLAGIRHDRLWEETYVHHSMMHQKGA